MEPGMKISVLISDPTRTKERSDAGARELRITGVVKSVTKTDLEKLFSPHGPLKDVRLLPALGNNQTAFVEFETEVCIR
jgi:squamous cell carcinoma antigen recognized by T-cells 3